MTESSSRLDPEQLYQSYLSRLPDDARARLAEPRDEDFKPPKGVGRPTCRLQAQEPATTFSPFLLLWVMYLSDSHQDLMQLATIHNVDSYFRFSGRGMGFDIGKVDGRPQLRMAFASRYKLPALWSLGRFFVASPKMHKLLRKYAPDALATVDIDVQFADGVSRQGYAFVDVVARRFAWDYIRSEMDVYLNDGRRHLELQSQRTLRADIPSTAHLFRDTSCPDELLVSRELAMEMEALGSIQLSFTDTQCEAGSNLRQQRIRNKHSRYKMTKPATYEDQQALRERLRSQVEPLVRNGEFVAAEKILTEWLRAMELTPYHIAADLQITTSPQDVASYFDAYARKASSEHELAAVYCEMNGFTINPDLWFCDAFGFGFDGGRDDYDWLGSFASSAEQSLVIEGLEPLQEVFKEAHQDPASNAPFKCADLLASALVIVKFQRLLQQARPLMRELKVPLLACAHDHYEYVAEIR